MHINSNNIIILPIYSVIFSPLSLAIIIRVYVIIPITLSVEEYYNLHDENVCVVDSTECVYLYIFLFNILSYINLTNCVRLNVENSFIIKTKDTKLNMKLTVYNSFAYLLKYF